jgi:hypothetical protein
MLERLDEAARLNMISRSGFIREAIAMRLTDEHRAPNPRREDIMRLLEQTGMDNGG